jgi:hypothetical protein
MRRIGAMRGSRIKRIKEVDHIGTRTGDHDHGKGEVTDGTGTGGIGIGIDDLVDEVTVAREVTGVTEGRGGVTGIDMRIGAGMRHHRPSPPPSPLRSRRRRPNRWRLTT